MTSILDELRARRWLTQQSHQDELENHLATGRRTVYCGFDPTAPSLHIGNLVPLLALRRFQLHGHQAIGLVGGATGLIGDPSGRDAERSFNSPETVAEWTERLRLQLGTVLDLDDPKFGLVVNNLDWTAELSSIQLLRDYGKHFAINAMVQRDAVRDRLEREGGGISYTEFSYMVLQGLDFDQLYQRYDCTLQLGGQDQWGNMLSGTDLIRRRHADQTYVITGPLVTRSDGKKFGKSVGGAIWLDPGLTSPFAFYQFWFNTPDADVESYLRLFTFIDVDDIASLCRESAQNPGARKAQSRLAAEMTKLIHGQNGLSAAERITEGLFTGEVDQLSSADLEQLQQDGMDSLEVAPNTTVVEAVATCGLAKSRGNARQLRKSGALRINGNQVETDDAVLMPENALHGRFHLVRRGKKSWALLVHPTTKN